jgi:hypothetical protein
LGYITIRQLIKQQQKKRRKRKYIIIKTSNPTIFLFATSGGIDIQEEKNIYKSL